MSTFPASILVVITTVVLFGTLYSIFYNTYLDTSDPILTHLPHHLHPTHYFASKSNVLNVYFTKKLWAWITAAFLSSYFTSPRSIRNKQRFLQFVVETAVWIVFATWFFGPSLLERVNASTGGECVLVLPSGAIVTVPQTYCFTKSTISVETHPSLFAASLVLPEDTWRKIPRLRRGHDVSGHIFLLMMGILFLADQIRYSFVPKSSSSSSGEAQKDEAWPPLHKYAVLLNVVVIALGIFCAYTTSVYFHTPIEKLTGYILGVSGFAITQLPIFQTSLSATPVVPNTPPIVDSSSGKSK